MQVLALIAFIILIESVIRYTDWRKRKHERVVNNIKQYTR